jgi:hypothetical protein
VFTRMNRRQAERHAELVGHSECLGAEVMGATQTDSRSAVDGGTGHAPCVSNADGGQGPVELRCRCQMKTYGTGVAGGGYAADADDADPDRRGRC